MNKITEEIFKHKVANFNKLAEYGFTKTTGGYVWQTNILDNQFSLTIAVDKNSDVQTKLIETSVGEEYTLFLADDAIGDFVGKVKLAYQDVLTNIATACFEKQVFKSDYAKKLIEYVSKKFEDELEYLWEKFPDYAVWRRKDNKKWYGLLVTIPYSKLGLNSNQMVEAIDLRMSPDDVQKFVDGKTIFAGYHMNKTHWITICLDGSVPLETIKQYLDQSYMLAK